MSYTYEDFKAELLEKMATEMEREGISVHERVMTKNNGFELDAMGMRHGDSIIEMVAYVQEFYEKFMEGYSVDEVVMYSKPGLLKRVIDETVLAPINHETAKENLFVEVVNAKANETMLREVPHRRVADLAIIPRFAMNLKNGDSGTFVVTEGYLPIIKMTKDEVLNTAIANTAKKEFICQSMAETLCETMKMDGINEEEILEMMEEICVEENPMYIVSNQEKVYGASILVCREQLEKCMERVGEECYILPSSIHEVILIPKSKEDLEKLQEMVKDVNRECVKAEEILSDSVYELHPKTRKLQIATGEVQCEVKNAEFGIERGKGLKM